MDDLNIDLGVLQTEPAEEYHAKASEHLSSHQLIDFMRCPWLHFKKRSGLIERRESPAFLLGRAAHARVLEGRDAYEAQFALGGPVNPRTGRAYGSNTKAFADWARQQGKPVLSVSQVEAVENIAAGVAMNDEAVELILYGQAEGVVRADYCGASCQVRLDWLHPHRGIVDLKTCDDLTYFVADARRYQYHHQLAFYRAVLAQKLDGLLAAVHIVAVEKKEPFRCGVWRVDEQCLASAQAEVEAAIRRWQACSESGQWPTGYEHIRVLDVA
jgi:hypothetical protein